MSQYSVYLRNAYNAKEDCSYLSVWLFGAGWNNNFEIWRQNQNIEALNVQALVDHGRFSSDDIAYLRKDETFAHWNNARYHRHMQTKLKLVVVTAMNDSPFKTELESFARMISSTDLYQGSPLLAFITEKLHDILRNKITDILPAAAQIGPYIR